MRGPSISQQSPRITRSAQTVRAGGWIQGLTKRVGGSSGEAATALLFLSPALVALILFRIAPAVSAIKKSLWSQPFFVGVPARFVGLDNYTTLLSSPDFRNSVKVTFLFCLITVLLQVVASLALAVLLSQHLPGTRVWRFLMFLPFSVPFGISTVVWGVAFRPDGPINAVLVALGFSSQPFTTSVTQAMPSIMVLASWIGIGYWMVFLLAGLQDVPTSYLEAAALDGAGWWQRFWHIVLPLLRRPIAFVLVADTVANFLVFVPVQVLTKGGPQGSTDFIMYNIYENAYALGNLPAASAEVVLLTAFMLVVVVVQFWLLPSEQRR